MKDIAPDAAGSETSPYGGEMGARMREADWAATPIGPSQAWPPALRALIGVMLGAGQPMFVTWGPERTLLYNDAYAPLLGQRHPSAFGRPMQAAWPEIWDDLAPLFESVDAGRPIHMDDIALTMHRHGYPEETHFAFSYTPVRDEAGAVAGMFCACQETTGQVMAARELRASEERLRAIVEGASDYAIITMNDEGVVNDWSAGAETIFGHAREEVMGKPAAVIFTPQDRADGADCDELTTAAREGCAEDVRWHLRKDGSRVFMNGTMRALHDADGGVSGFIKIARDETDRRLAVDRLVEDEHRFRLMSDDAPVIIWTTDPTGYCTYLNARWYAFTGQTQEEAEGFGWLDATHPDDKERAGEIFVQSNAERRDFYVEYRLRRADGGYSWAIDLASPRFGEDGEYLGYVGSVVDITERKAVEDALQASEARARALAEEQTRLAEIVRQTPDFVGVADPQGRPIFVNEGGRRMLGLPDLDAVRRTALTDYHAPAEARRLTEEVVPAVMRDGAWEGELEFRRFDDGATIPVEGRLFLVHDGDGELRAIASILSDISARKQTEEALRDSEAYVRLLLDTADNGFYAVDREGATTVCNRAFLRMLGFEREEDVLGRKLHGQIHHTHPDGTPYPKEDCPIYQAAALGREARVESELFFRADGTSFPVEYAAIPIRRDGELQGAICTFSDITERKRAEEGLRLRGEEFYALADNIPTLCWMAYADGHIFWYNRRWYAYTGADPDSQEGWGWESVHDPDVLPSVVERWNHSLATGEPFEMVFPLKGEDGVFRPFLTRVVPIRDDAGRIVRWFGTNVDITEQREIEAALERRVAERTAERDRIWRVSQDLLGVAALDGFFKSVNPAWTAVLGWSAKDILATPFMDLVHPEDREATAAEMSRLAEGATTLRFENRYQARDGSYRWLSWTAVPEEGLLYSVARDVTVEKAQAAELERAQEQLRQSQKMEAVGQLTGGVAHDFNNLLQVVVGNLELLQRSLPEDAARQRRSVDNAMSGAKRAATLTQRLLAFSRRQPLEPKPVEPNKLVRGMGELLTRALGETIELETVLAGGLWRVEVDPNQLENAILNLAVNARDAMPDGGKLTVETANTRLDESYAHQNVEVTPGQYVVICVSDTGTGMTKEAVGRAFEPFFTTKAVGHGTGLGLSQVYGFVKQSGGHVKIYSETDGGEDRHQGTTVKIYLPRFFGSAEGEAEVEDDTAPEAAPEEAVLVVEDDPDVRLYTVEVLRELGYAVTHASDGPTALKLLRDAATRCDLLFTDVVLPGGMNGEQLASAAHEARPGLKVLFTTGYARNAIVHQGRLDPGVQLITKPFSYADLAARVRDVLDGPAP